MSQEPSISIINEILKYSVVFILGIFASAIKRFVYKTECFNCAFKHPKIFEEPQYRKVNFSKRFGKTYKSDCPWFALDKIKGFGKLKHPYCPFGQDVKQIDNVLVGKCPFSNVKIVQSKI